MSAVVFQNRNRAHAVQQLKKYLKTEDEFEAEKYYKASIANALIFMGDSFEDIAKAMNPNTADSRLVEPIENEEEE